MELKNGVCLFMIGQTALITELYQSIIGDTGSAGNYPWCLVDKYIQTLPKKHLPYPEKS